MRGRLFVCEIGGLEPDSAYEYRVGVEREGEGSRSEAHRVRTAAADAVSPVSVAFFSDSALSGRSDSLAEAMPRLTSELAADAPFLILGGGDYVYADSDDRYLDPAEAIDAWLVQMEPLFARLLFMPAFGNHEVALGEHFADWAPRFVLPNGQAEGRSLSFDLGAARFSRAAATGRSLLDRAKLKSDGALGPAPAVGELARAAQSSRTSSAFCRSQ